METAKEREREKVPSQAQSQYPSCASDAVAKKAKQLSSFEATLRAAACRDVVHGRKTLIPGLSWLLIRGSHDRRLAVC
jgi:hypothetical protein